MINISYLLLLVFVGLASSLMTTYLPAIKTRILSFINKRQNKVDRRIEQLEYRVKLHESKDIVYLKKFDELEEQIDNLSGILSRRSKNDRDMIRNEVKEYLKQLQK